MLGCVIIGVSATVFFLFQIREAKLVKASKEVYDKFFMLEEVAVPKEGQVVLYDREKENELPKFGGEPRTPMLGKSQKLTKNQHILDTSSHDSSSSESVAHMFDQARQRVEERGTVSAGGAHFLYAPARKDRAVTPTRY